jgi:hypothetical protein
MVKKYKNENEKKIIKFMEKTSQLNSISISVFKLNNVGVTPT